MTITVQYLGQLRHLADKDADRLEVPAETGVAELLDLAAASYPPEFRSIIFENTKNLRPSLMVLLNDQPIDKAAAPPLRDGDQLTLLCAISGG